MKVVKLYPQSKLPFKNPDDLGYDMFAVVDDVVTIRSGEQKLVSLGVKIGFPKNFGAFLKERSGLASKGIHILGGVIDPSYVGEIKAIIYNSGKEDFEVQTGHKVCQMVIIPNYDFIVEEVKELKNTQRGENGFGSSGLT